MNIRQLIRRRRSWVALVTVVAAGGALAYVVPGAASGSTPSFYESCIAPYRAYPPEKLAVFEAECHTRASVVESVTPAQRAEEVAKLRAGKAARVAANTAAEAAEPAVKQETTLEAEPQALASMNHVFDPTSLWTGEVDGVWYEVYAGAKISPEGNEPLVRSELRIYKAVVNEHANSPAEQEYPVLEGEYPPLGGGTKPLTITAYKGDVLTVQTSTGETLYFDVATRSFVSE